MHLSDIVKQLNSHLREYGDVDTDVLSLDLFRPSIDNPIYTLHLDYEVLDPSIEFLLEELLSIAGTNLESIEF